MRALFLPAGALVLAVALVLLGGRMVDRPAQFDAATLDPPDPGDIVEFGDDLVVSSAAEPDDAAAAAALADQPAESAAAVPPAAPAASRLVDPAAVAPAELPALDLQREAPRAPLSQLSLALPPEPELKNEWAGTPLFRPLAVESAVFQSAGRTIAIAGVKSVPVDESCVHDGVAWPCGMRARTAFRLWLRGRALVCRLPEQELEVTPARCRLAKQDAGAWLVANGWALAAPDGPYVQAEEKARAEKIGVFGAPPEAPAVADVPDAPFLSAVPDLPVMTEDGVDPDPPADPRMAFPPAPPAP
ncbi:MAG: thermonuclease family protein [Hyphomicrobiales bacterium]|nr:thermonuclease family protein [Hyphomicrobiales bacterium]